MLSSEPRKDKGKFEDFLKYSGLAFEMLAIMGLGIFIGFKADQCFELEFPALH